jgi:hypothetical protein
MLSVQIELSYYQVSDTLGKSRPLIFKGFTYSLYIQKYIWPCDVGLKFQCLPYLDNHKRYEKYSTLYMS